MAEKKNTAKKTSVAKNTESKAAGEKKTGKFPEAYVRFRTILDGFELTAMRYLLKDENEAARIKRADELEKIMMPIIKKYQEQTMSGGGPGSCPPGMIECNGCCVAYPCPH